MLSDVPVGVGYVDVMAGASQLHGLFARGEVGYRARKNLGLFGFAQVDRLDTSAGIGARLTF